MLDLLHQLLELLFGAPGLGWGCRSGFALAVFLLLLSTGVPVINRFALHTVAVPTAPSFHMLTRNPEPICIDAGT